MKLLVAKRQLDEYLASVRAMEQRIEAAEKSEAASAPDYPVPAGVPQAFEEHLRLMYDLIALAFRADVTRIVTLMHANCGSNRSYRWIGVPEGVPWIHWATARAGCRISSLRVRRRRLWRRRTGKPAGHDAVIYGGNSGGSLVSLDGEIVGINEVGLGSLGDAIPANLAQSVAEQLIKKGVVERS